MNDRPRSASVIPSIESGQKLPQTNTQKDLASAVSRSVRPTAQRTRGCAYRPMLDGTALDLIAKTAVELATARAAAGEPALTILDLASDPRNAWAGLFEHLHEARPQTALRFVAVRDRDAARSMPSGEAVPDLDAIRGAAKQRRYPLESFLTEATPSEWPAVHVPLPRPLVVNAGFALHHIPDDGFGPDSARTRMLRKLCEMAPKLVIVTEPDFGPGAGSLKPRFGNHPNSAHELLDILAGLREETPAPDGVPRPHSTSPLPDRPELPDRSENWQRRFESAGFVPVDLAPLRGPILMRARPPGACTLVPDKGAFRIAWQGRPLIHVSAWQPGPR